MATTAVIVVTIMKFTSEIPTANVNVTMSRGFCCFVCGHCDDEVIAEMSGGKCKCHKYD